jgi:membrane-associated phospholipid phosphatase
MHRFGNASLLGTLVILSASAAGAEPEAAALPAQAVVPVRAPERSRSLAPALAEPKPPGRVTFQSDPIADGAIIVVSLGSAGLLELINSTGEIRPQQIDPNFDRSQLIWIDRAAVTNTMHPSAGTLSNVGLGIAGIYAVLDPVLSGLRERSVQTGLVDAIMYSETVALTLALTNIVKMAVRRPRPLAYVAAEEHKDDDPTPYSNSSTDSSLSFFSGHASMTSAIGATATYLAFARSPGTWRPWVTLSLATTVSTLVSVYRVRAGKHFPTDVLAGTFAGAGIGIVVPHLHRTEDVQQRRVWVGFAPEMQEQRMQGGSLTLRGSF